jgi:hypothetical protein
METLEPAKSPPKWQIGDLLVPAVGEPTYGPRVPGVQAKIVAHLWCGDDARAVAVIEFEAKRLALLARVESESASVRSEDAFVRLERVQEQRASEDKKLADAKSRGAQALASVRDAVLAGEPSEPYETAAREAAADSSICERKLSTLQELENELSIAVSARRRTVRAERRAAIVAELKQEGAALEAENVGYVAAYFLKQFEIRQLLDAMLDESRTSENAERRESIRRRQRQQAGLEVAPVDPSEPFFKEPIAIRLTAGGDPWGGKPNVNDD